MATSTPPAPSGARVVLVGDNRDNPNWGSRATSMALLSLLEGARLAPRERVMDAEVQATVPIARSASADRWLRRPTATRLARAALARGGRSGAAIERLFGLSDAVSDDPAATAAAWLRRPHRPELARLVALVRGADALVVNGEGSMIFSRRARREQQLHLALMHLAGESGVPFAYVNALAADPPHGPRNDAVRAATARVLETARLVTARDPESLRYLRELSPDIPARFVPDAVFAWAEALGEPARSRLLTAPEYLVPHDALPERLGPWRFDEPYVCVGGSSEAAKDPPRARAAYGRLLDRLTGVGLRLVVTVSCLGDAFLEDLAVDRGLTLVPPATNVWAASAILAGADLVVTGRYHPTILAGLGGAPAVLLGADSHKTRSVQEMLGYPDVRVLPAFPDSAACAEVALLASDRLAHRATWSAAILRTCALRADEARRLGPALRQALARGPAPALTAPAPAAAVAAAAGAR